MTTWCFWQGSRSAAIDLCLETIARHNADFRLVGPDDIHTIEGGEIQYITCDDDSTLNLFGGQILGDLKVEDLTAWVHIYGYGFNNDPFPGSPLTGFWADDTAFSINLVDSTISTYDQIIFHEIPEPTTLTLLGLGICIIRKRS